MSTILSALLADLIANSLCGQPPGLLIWCCGISQRSHCTGGVLHLPSDRMCQQFHESPCGPKHPQVVHSVIMRHVAGVSNFTISKIFKSHVLIFTRLYPVGWFGNSINTLYICITRNTSPYIFNTYLNSS